MLGWLVSGGVRESRGTAFALWTLHAGCAEELVVGWPLVFFFGLVAELCRSVGVSG